MEDVLFIEKQNEAVSLLSDSVEGNHWRFESAHDPEQAEQWMQRRAFQAAVLDLDLAPDLGEALLERLKQAWPLTQFVAIAPSGDAARGLRALKLGAYDKVCRPLDRAALEAALKRACERTRLGRDLRAARLREEHPAALLGSSPAAQALRDALTRAAGHEANVLILGEPGSGKRLAARFLRDQSARRKGPFVALDCAALARDGEHALFGRPDEPGALELAAGGVLLLEHVELLAAPLQAQVLKILRDRTFTPKHSMRSLSLDARVLATAGENLRTLVKAGGFREDLYWNLGSSLRVPPLRERPGDGEELLGVFLRRQCERLGRPLPVLSPEATEAVQSHAFPGNVGELEALACLIAAGAREQVALADLPLSLSARQDGAGRPLKALVRAFERQVILGTLKAAHGNQSRAAERLAVHRNTLILKMQELGIPNKRTQKRGRAAKR